MTLCHALFFAMILPIAQPVTVFIPFLKFVFTVWGVHNFLNCIHSSEDIITSLSVAFYPSQIPGVPDIRNDLCLLSDGLNGRLLHVV